MTHEVALLYDCERCTHEFFPVLDTASLQVYHSALLFIPRQTSLRETHGHELVVPIKIYNAVERTWNSCTRTLDGTFQRSYSVACSPDGTRIVSGFADQTLRLWDAIVVPI